MSLSFDSLICIGSPSQHDSGYLCPQAECQCLFSAYKYPPDTVCHVYSWTFLTFDNTLDISLAKFQIAFYLIKYQGLKSKYVLSQQHLPEKWGYFVKIIDDFTLHLCLNIRMSINPSVGTASRKCLIG